MTTPAPKERGGMGGEYPERDDAPKPGMGGEYPEQRPERGGTGGEMPERGDKPDGGMGGEYPEGSQAPVTSGDRATGKTGILRQPEGQAPNVPSPMVQEGAPD